MKINICYQDIFQGKEFADSLSRYICYCLEEDRPVNTDMSMNSYKLFDNQDDYYILCFTDIYQDISLWGSFIGKLEKKAEEKKWMLRIVDVTLQNEFAIKTVPGHIIITPNAHCLDWLSRLTTLTDAEEISIELSPDYLRTYYSVKEHAKTIV